MAEEPRGILIVTVEDAEGLEETKRRVLGIEGVVEAEVNHLTRKLMVTYRGDSAGMRKVESQVKKVLEAERHSERKQPRRVPGRRPR